MVTQLLRDYELVIVLSPERDEQQIEDSVQRVIDFVSAAGGAVTEEEYWGLRRLAYPINRFLEGSYVLLHFSLEAQQVLELDQMLLASEHVLRYLITKPDKSEKKA